MGVDLPFLTSSYADSELRGLAVISEQEAGSQCLNEAGSSRNPAAGSPDGPSDLSNPSWLPLLGIAKSAFDRPFDAAHHVARMQRPKPQADHGDDRNRLQEE